MLKVGCYQCAEYASNDSRDIHAGHQVRVNSLDSIAVYNEEKGMITIFTVNRAETDLETEFTLGGFSGYKIAEHIQMTNADLKAVNDMACPDRVKPVSVKGAVMENEKLKTVFPRLSWNVIRLSRE
jgi:alpha-N-arabinofuranosidase